MSFRGDADAAWDLPAKYPAHSFNRSAHGCGMTGEYPYLSHHGDCPDAGYHRVIEPGVTLCVESLIGADGGPEGVKLDRQLLITAMGVVVLSEFPFEAALLP